MANSAHQDHARQRHQIPTHLNVEDKVIWGLSVRQVTYVVLGAASAYALWDQWPHLPTSLRLAQAVAVLVIAAAFALIRPYGRGLEEWAFVSLHYVAIPKVNVWRPREPDPARRQSTVGDWQELAPQLFWEAPAR